MQRERISSTDCRPSWNSALRFAARSPVVAHRQPALVQGVDELRAAVEVQRVGALEALVDQAVLDHPRRHAEQHQQVLLHQPGTAAHVEHGDDAPGRVKHRHRRAGQLRELGEEVIFAAHRHRRCGDQAGAHAVRARRGLAPHAAGAQAERRDLGRKFGRRHHVHDDTVDVGQQYRRLVVGELLVQRRHLVARAVDHVGVAGLPLVELGAADHRRLARLVRVQPVVIEAAAPRAHDHIVGLVVKAASHHVHDMVGVSIGQRAGESRTAQGQWHSSLQSAGPSVPAAAPRFWRAVPGSRNG